MVRNHARAFLLTGSVGRSFRPGARRRRGLRRLLLLLSALTLGVAPPATAQSNVSLGLDYWSDYFWYPSSEYWNSPAVGGHGDDYRGLSDIVASIRATTDVWSRFTPHASLNVAFVPDQDFYRVWGKDQHFHVWATVGVSYRWSL
jgi:hypothetical protein